MSIEFPWLVVLTILKNMKKYESQWKDDIPYIMENKNVPSQQPVFYIWESTIWQVILRITRIDKSTSSTISSPFPCIGWDVQNPHQPAVLPVWRESCDPNQVKISETRQSVDIGLRQLGISGDIRCWLYLPITISFQNLEIRSPWGPSSHDVCRTNMMIRSCCKQN